MSKFLPVNRLRENQSWLAFYHPQPDYPVHISIVNKLAYVSLLDVLETDHVAAYGDLFKLVQTLVNDFQLCQQGYRLITNGGPNQAVPLWHWHLVSENPGASHD